MHSQCHLTPNITEASRLNIVNKHFIKVSDNQVKTRIVFMNSVQQILSAVLVHTFATTENTNTEVQQYKALAERSPDHCTNRNKKYKETKTKAEGTVTSVLHYTQHQEHEGVEVNLQASLTSRLDAGEW